MDLRRNQHRRFVFVAALAVSLPYPSPLSNAFEQDKNRLVSSGASLAPTVSWLQFEKCPVFAIESIELPAQDSGVISSLAIQVNDAVQSNQVLGKLDNRTAEIEKNAASLQAQSAATEASEDIEVRVTQAQVEEAKLQFEQCDEMNRRGTLGDNELRQKQLVVFQAECRLEQSKATKLQKEQKAKLAQMALLASQLKLERCTLRSPVNGTVTRIDHRPGEFVQAGATILSMVRLNELRVDCFVNIDQVTPSKLVHLPVKVTMKRAGEELVLAGRITSYDPDVSSGGMVRVHATIQNQRDGDHWQVLPGMSVTMQVAQPSR
jgi:multidrug resistance efflux pump